MPFVEVDIDQIIKEKIKGDPVFAAEWARKDEKVSTYEGYRRLPGTFSIEEMEKMLQENAEEIGRDEDALEIWEDLEKQAAKYAKIRAEWYLMSREERMEKDAGRTACHNSLIVKVNVLARYLKKQGQPAKWLEKFGDPEAALYYRKRIGDFGCYIAFVNGICAR